MNLKVNRFNFLWCILLGYAYDLTCLRIHLFLLKQEDVVEIREEYTEEPQNESKSGGLPYQSRIWLSVIIVNSSFD